MTIEKENIDRAREQLDLAFSLGSHQIVPWTDMTANDVITQLTIYWEINKLGSYTRKEYQPVERIPVKKKTSSYLLSQNKEWGDSREKYEREYEGLEKTNFIINS